MATVRTALQIFDGMTPAFKTMHQVMVTVIDSFEALNVASDNAIDITSIQEARYELSNIEVTIDEVERSIREADTAQQDFNNQIQNGQSVADGLESSIRNIATAVLSVAAAKKGIDIVNDWLGLADIQYASERQLANVMSNMGAVRDEYESVKRVAAELQDITTFGAADLLGGAAEIATYLSSGEAIELAMEVLVDYTAGMGGMEVDKRAIVEYATQLGKAFDGQFDGLRKKGFDVTDAQKQIIEYGTELERVAVITDIINQSWDGLAVALTNTPQGQLLQMKNTWADIKTELGMYVYPAVLRFFQTINSNMPQVETVMMAFATAIVFIIDVLNLAATAAGYMSSIIIDNWSWIGPIILGIVAALGILTTALILQKGALYAVAAAKWALNAALLASPITWIIIAVIGLVVVIYLAIEAINHFAGTSISATGVVAGVFLAALAVIANMFIYVWNVAVEVFVTIYNIAVTVIEGLVNIFSGDLAAIGRMFALLGDDVLGILESIARGIDFVFGSNLTGAVAGWRSSLQGLISDAYGDHKIQFDRMDASDWQLQPFDVVQAYNVGYDWGAGLGDRFEGAFKMDELLSNVSTLDDINGSGADTAANTARMADSLDASEEDLKYLRDLAEQEVVNRFTTAEIKVEMTNHNTVNSNMDLDGIVAYLEDNIYETMIVAAEGVHD